MDEDKTISVVKPDEPRDLNPVFNDPKIHKNDDGTVTLFLTKPITVGKESKSDLIFNEPTIADMEAGDIGKGPIESSRYIVASIVGVPPSSLKKMTSADFRRCSAIVAYFTGNAATDGEDG